MTDDTSRARQAHQQQLEDVKKRAAEKQNTVGGSRRARWRCGGGLFVTERGLYREKAILGGERARELLDLCFF